MSQIEALKKPAYKQTRPIQLMRELYNDYNHYLPKMRAKESLDDGFKTNKSAYAVRLSQIVSETQTTQQNYFRRLHTSQHKQSKLESSFYFKTKSRKQLEQCQDIKKGQFKKNYSNNHDFMRPNRSFKQKQISKQKFYISMQELDPQLCKLALPHSRRQDLQIVKKKLQQAKKIRTQISNNLRYNYLLKNRYKHNSNQMKDKLTLNIDSFQKTKENIFPSSTVLPH